VITNAVAKWIVVAVAAAASGSAVYAQPRQIDTAHSSMTVHVYKAGMLSAFGHDHEIAARIAGGSVDVRGRKVELTVNAGTLRVEDPKASEKDRAEIQSTMLGSEVLDTATYKDIRFHSTSAEAAGPGAWKVSGELNLHGQTKPVSIEVKENNGHYTGTCRFNITDFGIKPVKVAGGAVRVKDEVQIDFDLQLAQ